MPAESPLASRDCEAYPYGETRITSGTIYTDKLFTGQREMTGLGIYHYGARFYSPKLGRFLSADTIVPGAANPQAYNRYSYVLNNPVRYIDPTGHMDEDPDDGDVYCPHPPCTRPTPSPTPNPCLFNGGCTDPTLSWLQTTYPPLLHSTAPPPTVTPRPTVEPLSVQISTIIAQQVEDYDPSDVGIPDAIPASCGVPAADVCAEAQVVFAVWEMITGFLHVINNAFDSLR